MHVAQAEAFEGVEIDILGLDGLVLTDRQGARVDRLGDLLRGRAAVGGVELDAEVAVRAARVVAGREDDAAGSGVLADHAGGGRGGEDAALADQAARHAVGGGHAQDHLDRLAVVEAPVAADHQGAAAQRVLGVEDALHEVFQVVLALEHADLFAQARGAGLLVVKRGGGDGLDLHD